MDSGGQTDAEVVDPAVEHALAQLTAGVEALLSLDPTESGAEGLLEPLVALNHESQRLAAACARLARAYEASRAWLDTGARSAAALLAHRCGLPAYDAKAQVRLGRDLEVMPAVVESLCGGGMGLPHARKLARLARNPRTGEAFCRDEHMLVDYAQTMAWPAFSRIVAYWEQCNDPDGVEDRARDDDKARRVQLWEGVDGSGFLDGWLTPIANATVGGALQRIGDELFQADWTEAKQRLGRDPSVLELLRTPAQRRHDALVELANRALTAPRHGKRPPALVTVLVGYETFAGRICQLADGTVVTPGTVARLLDGDALIERIVFDGPSRVIDVGQARLFSGALRRAIEVRDRECQWPSCYVPYPHCQADHVQPHNQGGPTTQENGQLLCGPHNRFKHTGRAPP